MMSRLYVAASAVLFVACFALAAPDRGDDFEREMRVPAMPTAPTIDGVVDPAEWKHALMITGVSGNPLGTPFLVPQQQQVQWLLGFHGDMLYIAMRSPHPKGTYPNARIKDNDNDKVLFEDHTEIQILTNDRADAGRAGKGFYKMMVNPWGALSDMHWWNGTPGTEDFWSTGGQAKSHVTDEMWQMELSVKASQIKLPRFDGQKAVMQLVRADDPGGIYFAGIVGSAWMSWKSFPDVFFDAAAPVLQLRQLGQIGAGEVDLAADVTAATGAAKPQEVALELSIQDAAGKVLFQDKQTVTVDPGQTRTLTMKTAGLAVSEVDINGGRNSAEIKATWIDGKKTHVLYSNRMLFMKFDATWKAKYLDPWVERRPRSGQWDASFAYLPYTHKALAKVDVDFFGMDAAIRKAGWFEVTVRPEGGDAALARAAAALDGRGEVFFDSPSLPDGNYDAVFTLLDKQGGKQVASQTVAFVRKTYPWEHNDLGKSDEVIPPFEPMSVNPKLQILDGAGAAPRARVSHRLTGDAIYLWGRVIEVGPGGLPAQVLTSPPSGTAGSIEPLLTSPVRLEATSGGKPIEITAEIGKVTESAPHRVLVQGDMKLGAAPVHTSATVEYDGWYEVELQVAPAAGLSLDTMDLVIDFDQRDASRSQARFPVDTLYVQRLSGDLDNSYHGPIAAKPGVFYQSTSLLPPKARTGPADVAKDWKSFCPITYVGNGDRGMWCFLWSDQGFTMTDDDPVVRVERLADGDVRLRVRFISGPVKLDRPRTIRFALQPAPIKRNDACYRTELSRIAHDTSGYRYYGDSVDAYALHGDEDYAALRKYLLYGRARGDMPQDRYAHWAGRIGKMLREGVAKQVMMYGSQWMTGLGAEEFDSFGGEWMGRNNWKPDPDLKFAGKTNYGNTVTWETPRQLTAARVNWPASMVDFFVYYHERLIDKAGFNGTWWDNCYSGTVTEYDAELGRLDARWNLLMRRDLCKRLNVVGWEHLRQPVWSMNTQVEMSWCQVFWMVEGFWGPSAADVSAIDHFGNVGFFRAASRTKSHCMIANTSYMGKFRGSTPEKDRAMKRSADGILLLHDIPPHHDKAELLRRLNFAVEYANTARCLFMGYWMSEPFVKTTDPAVLASVYLNREMGSGVIVFYNTGKKSRYLGGTAFAPAGVTQAVGGRPVEADAAVELKRVYDLETGATIRTSFRDGMMVVDEPMIVEADGYRLLAVESR